jgi:ribA/ribD-fused uncharacterized protein
MKSIKRLLSPSSDKNSPPNQKARLDLDSQVDQVQFSDTDSLDNMNVEGADNAQNCLTQPGAPDYFNDSMKVLQDMLSPLSKLDALIGTVNSLMGTLQHVQAEATEAKNLAQMVRTDNVLLNNELTEIKRKFAHLESKQGALSDKIIDQDTYSRRDNLVFEGIPEKTNENLQHIMISLFHDMEVVSPEQIEVVRCHRLEGSPVSPKPIIIRFQRHPDRQRVWGQRFKLKGKNIFLKENFAPETEVKRRILLPILMAARKMPDVKKCTITHQGKLLIDSTYYTVNTLNTLPVCLQLETLSVRENEKALVFKGRHSVFSNFNPSEFKSNGMSFNCTEQFLWFNCAKLFKDEGIADALMRESDPGKQKALSRKISGFDNKMWSKAMEDIIETGVRDKFSQNPMLKDKLMATRGKALGEATKRNTVWGTGIDLHHKDALDTTKWSNNLLGKVLMKVRDA